MANSDIREFYFYNQYIWRPEDFENLQEWLRDIARGVAEGAFGKSVLSGLKASANGGLNVAVAAGIAVNENGRLIVSPSQEIVTLLSPVGNPSRNLIVLRPVDEDAETIDEPTNPTNPVPLHKKITFEVVVLTGTPAATPQYPATQSGDVIVAGVKLAAGAVAVAQADIESVKRDVPKVAERRIRQIASNYTIDENDDIIEVAATGGSITLTLMPSVSRGFGRQLTVVLISNSGGSAIISGGGELISGQATQELEETWDSANLYPNNASWRMF